MLRRNIAKCRYEDRARVISGDTLSTLPQLSGTAFDLILLDPPYQKNLYSPVLFSVIKYHLLDEYGILVSEHSKTVPFSWQEEGLNLYKTRSYGETVLNFFRAQ